MWRSWCVLACCVLPFACGADDGGGTGSGDAGTSADAGTAAGDGGTGAASGSASSAGADQGSGTASGADADRGDTTGTFTGDCDSNVSLALAENLGLGAMTVDAIRREFDGNDIPLYLVQVYGSDTGPDRLDIAFAGQPVAGTTYDASGEVGGVQNTPLIGLYPTTAEGRTFVAGTATYAEVGVLEGELLVLQLDLQFEGGTITGCIAQPIHVEFSAPP